MFRKWFLIFLIFMANVVGINAQNTIAVGETLTDTLPANGTLDYLFEAQEGMFLVAHSDSTEFSTSLQIYDASGGFLKWVTDHDATFKSELHFLVPQTGQYLLRIGAILGGGGAFTLSLIAEEFAQLNVGDSVELEFDAENQAFYFGYQGISRDLIQVSAVTDGTLDTALTLFLPNGHYFNEDDNSGENNDPLLQGEILWIEGLYVIKLAAVLETPIEGRAVLSVKAGELPNLDDGTTQTANFNKTVTSYFGFSAEAGKTYRLTFTMDSQVAIIGTISINGEEVSSQNFEGFSEITFDFTATETGAGMISLTNYTLISFDLSLTPVE